MDKNTSLELDKQNNSLANNFVRLLKQLWKSKKQQFNRVLPLGEYFVDRHEKAAFLGFGKGTTIYDSTIVLGDVEIGENTWVGPFVVLDGSGGLKIGSHCSISAGVQIYSHDSVDWAVTGGKEAYKYSATEIKDNCYIGPNVVIQRGVVIGKGSCIGANSFVNQSIPENTKAAGSPAKIIGKVKNGEHNF